MWVVLRDATQLLDIGTQQVSVWDAFWWAFCGAFRTFLDCEKRLAEVCYG